MLVDADNPTRPMKEAIKRRSDLHAAGDGRSGDPKP
jgi:hypothetical protein